MLYFVLNLHLKARGFFVDCVGLIWVPSADHSRPTFTLWPRVVLVKKQAPIPLEVQVDYLFNGISGKNHCFSRFTINNFRGLYFQWSLNFRDTETIWKKIISTIFGQQVKQLWMSCEFNKCTTIAVLGVQHRCFLKQSKKQSNSYVPWLRHLQIHSFVNVFTGFTNAVHQNLYASLHIYHLEKRWRNCHVLVYHGPLLNHLWGGCAIYFHYAVFGIIWNLHSV